MNKIKFIIICILAAVFSSQVAVADEGMWLIHTINAALEKKMQERGLKLSAREIYNADAPGTRREVRVGCRIIYQLLNCVDGCWWQPYRRFSAL